MLKILPLYFTHTLIGFSSLKCRSDIYAIVCKKIDEMFKTLPFVFNFFKYSHADKDRMV